MERGFKKERFVRSQCEKLHLIKSKNPILMGLYANFVYNGRLQRPFKYIIYKCERALGGGAVSRLKLGARLMMRGKGDTCHKREGDRFKAQRVIIRVENWALLTPSKIGPHQG